MSRRPAKLGFAAAVKAAVAEHPAFGDSWRLMMTSKRRGRFAKLYTFALEGVECTAIRRSEARDHSNSRVALRLRERHAHFGHLRWIW